MAVWKIDYSTYQINRKVTRQEVEHTNMYGDNICQIAFIWYASLWSASLILGLRLSDRETTFIMNWIYMDLQSYMYVVILKI